LLAQPITRDYVIPQGVTFPIRMRWLDNGTPVDLTGALVRAQLKTSYSAQPAYSATIANGKAYLDVATGWFGFDLIPTDTSAITATQYVYDIEVELPTGDITRAMQGKITLTPEVTR